MTLPTASYVPVAPPADGLALAFRAARRRRQGKAAAASGAGFVAVALLLTLGGGAGNQTLLQEPPTPARGGLPAPLGPDSTTSEQRSAADLTPADAGSPTQAGSALVAGTARSTAPRAAGTVATPADAGRAGGAGAMSTGTAESTPVSGPMKRDTSINVPSDVTCPVRKRQDGSRSLCTEVFPYSGQKEGTTEFQAALCNTETYAVTLTYATAKELDIVVSLPKGGELWRWSVGHQFEATPHTVVVGPGDCVIWNTTWAGVDQHGEPLPKGSYAVTAEFGAKELPQADQVARSTYTAS